MDLQDDGLTKVIGWRGQLVRSIVEGSCHLTLAGPIMGYGQSKVMIVALRLKAMGEQKADGN